MKHETTHPCEKASVLDTCPKAAPSAQTDDDRSPPKQKRKLEDSRKFSEPMIAASPKSSADEGGQGAWDWRGAPEITISFVLDHELCVSKVLASSQAEIAGVGVGWKLRWVEVTGRDCTWSVPITKAAEVPKAFAECRTRRNKKIVAVFALDQVSAAIRYPEDEVFSEASPGP